MRIFGIQILLDLSENANQNNSTSQQRWVLGNDWNHKKSIDWQIDEKLENVSFAAAEIIERVIHSDE